jgi:hypothetical protein
MGSGQAKMWDDYDDYKSLCNYFDEIPRSAMLGVSLPYSMDWAHFDELKLRLKWGPAPTTMEKKMPCDECGVNLRDPPSKLCPGCQAYKEHQA